MFKGFQFFHKNFTNSAVENTRMLKLHTQPNANPNPNITLTLIVTKLYPKYVNYELYKTILNL